MTASQRARGVLAAGLAALVPALAAAPSASASALIARDVRGPVTLKVNRSGVALVSYVEAGGSARHVLVWGGINRSPKFKVDYSGGWGSHVADWRTFRNACRAYRGPHLPFTQRGWTCTAPDGSFWAVQQWRRVIDQGSRASGQRELRVSHWSGPLAQIWVKGDWSWHGRFKHMYGRLTYRGRPVFGRCHTPTGYVCDLVGRNVLVDALDSDYGRGWRRVNGFLASPPSGQFCYGFNRKDHGDGTFSRYGVSKVNRYRISVAGPYVSPDISREFHLRTGAYDADIDAVANAEQRRLVGSNTHCNCLPVN